MILFLNYKMFEPTIVNSFEGYKSDEVESWLEVAIKLRVCSQFWTVMYHVVWRRVPSAYKSLQKYLPHGLWKERFPSGYRGPQQSMLTVPNLHQHPSSVTTYLVTCCPIPLSMPLNQTFFLFNCFCCLLLCIVTYWVPPYICTLLYILSLIIILWLQ